MPNLRITMTPFLLKALLLAGIQSPAIGVICQAQIRSLTLNDCKTNGPVPEVRIFDETNKLLGTTDVMGRCSIHMSSFPIFIEKAGYNIIPAYREQDLENICMGRIIERQLGEVAVSSKKLSIQDYLLQLRIDNLSRFIDDNTDTILYYRFSYTLEFPDHHWKEQATGYIANELIGKMPILCDYYIQYQYSSTDSSFWNTREYKDAHPIPLNTIRYCDILGRNNIGRDVWRKLAHPDKKEKRQLVMNHNSAGDQIFDAYYDTSGYKTEQIVFDSIDNLQTVDFYTPEFPTRYFFYKFYDDFALTDGEKSTFHSHYIYSKSLPHVLQQATHLSTFHGEKAYYRTTFQLDLVDKAPEINFKILDSPITKVQDVLKEIKRFQKHEKK